MKQDLLILLRCKVISVGRNIFQYVALFVAVLSLVGCTDKEVNIVFLTNDEAAHVLATEDDYLQSLQPFDLQFNFGVLEKPNQAGLLSRYTQMTQDWPQQYQQRVQASVDRLSSKIADLELDYPDTIQFILSRAELGGRAAYTRMNTIVWPEDFMMFDDELFDRIIAHEFFHVYSRYHQSSRDKLYAGLGYYQTQALTLPPLLAQLKITNPDAPILDFAIDLDYRGKQQTFMPVLLAKRPYDAAHQAAIYEYFSNQLLAVEIHNGNPVPVLENGKPVVVPQEETNFVTVVSPNTPYLLNPEEISAENFSLWVVDADVEHQRPIELLIDAMRALKK